LVLERKRGLPCEYVLREKKGNYSPDDDCPPVFSPMGKYNKSDKLETPVCVDQFFCKAILFERKILIVSSLLSPGPSGGLPVIRHFHIKKQ
jgi:hypothetical protein